MRKLLLLMAIIFITGNSCHKKDVEADEKALVKMTAEDWTANVLSGNSEANIYNYTDNAVRINHGNVLTGKDAIRSAFNSYANQKTLLKLENKVEDTWISGDLATVRGSYSETFIRKEAGDTINEKGVWVDVCERQPDGSWKMVLNLITELKD